MLMCVMCSVADRPKIRMPRFLRQRYVANVGEKINLTIPFSVSTHFKQPPHAYIHVCIYI